MNRKVELILAGFLSRVKAGESLVPADSSIPSGMTPRIIKSRLYIKIALALSEGQSLSGILGAISGVPPLVVELIKRGESSGNLGSAIEAALAHYRTSNRFSYHLNKITGYSMVIFVMLILCYSVFYAFIAPIFESMYAQLGAHYSLGPWGILNSDAWIPVTVFGLIGLAVWTRVVRHTSLAGLVASALPVLRQSFRRLISLEILSAYSGHIAAGLDSASALQESAASVSDYSYKKSLQGAAAKVSEGMNISEALNEDELLKGLEATSAISLYDSTGGDSPVIEDTRRLLDEYLRLTLDRDMKLVLILAVSVLGLFVAITVISLFNLTMGIYQYL